MYQRYVDLLQNSRFPQRSGHSRAADLQWHITRSITLPGTAQRRKAVPRFRRLSPYIQRYLICYELCQSKALKIAQPCGIYRDHIFSE